MILVGDFFHVSNNTTFVSGIKRTNFNFEFPCKFDLLVDGKSVQKIHAEARVLDNNYFIDDLFEKITVSVEGHLSKELIANKVDVCLKIG